MLYNLSWLKENEPFPPKVEVKRLNDYTKNAALFDLVNCNEFENVSRQLISNIDDFINFPVILAYQRLVTVKLADMVCGAVPSITAKTDELTDEIQQIRDTTNFDEKLYMSTIDYSRLGVAVFRLYKSEETSKGDFTCWYPGHWFPILRNDGTNRISHHVLAWRKNVGTESLPKYNLEVQIHPIEGKYYDYRVYAMDDNGTNIGKIIYAKRVSTGNMPCLIQYAANIASSTNVYGTSDYVIINTLVYKATERIKQILRILDKHADPSMTGPVSLLEENEKGEQVLKLRQFYATGPDEQSPKYLTWDGQLDSAFKALEFLLNQLYILSEMGDAFLGASEKTGQAISGTAMRFKMASPLIKARRVTNAITLPVKKLMATLLAFENENVRYQDLSIKWEDSLPKDPREQAELIRLMTGEPAIMPLKSALMEQYDMTSEDADEWVKQIDERADKRQTNDTTPNVQKKGSTQAVTSGTEGSTGTANTNSGSADR